MPGESRETTRAPQHPQLELETEYVFLVLCSKKKTKWRKKCEWKIEKKKKCIQRQQVAYLAKEELFSLGSQGERHAASPAGGGVRLRFYKPTRRGRMRGEGEVH